MGKNWGYYITLASVSIYTGLGILWGFTWLYIYPTLPQAGQTLVSLLGVYLLISYPILLWLLSYWKDQS